LRIDPIGLIGGVNVFSYVQNRPLNIIDPMGLVKKVPRRLRDPDSCCQDFGGCYDRCREGYFTGIPAVEAGITVTGIAVGIIGFFVVSNPAGWVVGGIGIAITAVGGSGFVYCGVKCLFNPCAYPEPEPEGLRGNIPVTCASGEVYYVDAPLVMMGKTDTEPELIGLGPELKYPSELTECLCHGRGTRCEHIFIQKGWDLNKGLDEEWIDELLNEGK
jgi:hypothetical protein